MDISPCGTNSRCVSALEAVLPEFRSAGVQYAVVEAAQKPELRQTSYAQFQAFHNAGFKTAAYCFMYFDTPTYSSGVQQATNCLTTVGNALPNVSFVALDVEEFLPTYNQAGDIALLNGALFVLEQSGVKPVIYTAASLWGPIIGSTTQFSTYPLWRAGLPESFTGYIDPAGNLNCDNTAASLTPTLHGGDLSGAPVLIPVSFGGWSSTSGVQYDIGQDGTGGACLFGMNVDFDVFSPSLF